MALRHLIAQPGWSVSEIRGPWITFHFIQATALSESLDGAQDERRGSVSLMIFRSC